MDWHVTKTIRWRIATVRAVVTFDSKWPRVNKWAEVPRHEVQAA
jgi:hypothetical protein